MFPVWDNIHSLYLRFHLLNDLQISYAFCKFQTALFLALGVMSEVSTVDKLVDQTGIESNTIVAQKSDQERALEMLYPIEDH